MNKIYSVLFCLTLLPAQPFMLGSAAQSAPAKRGAPAAANRAKPSGASNAVYQAYLAGIRNKVTPNWELANGKNHVVLTTMISADGGTEGLTTVSTPKNAAAEQAASDAFGRSLPFPALPAGINPPAKLTLTFESSADPHGDSSSNLYTRLDPAAPPKPAAAAAAPKSEPAAATPAAAPATDTSTPASGSESAPSK